MIAINATILDSRPTGLGVVAREIAAGVARLAPGTAVFSSRPESLPAAEVQTVPSWVCTRRGPPLGGLARFLWAQVFLPLRLKRLGAGVLLSPNHEAVFFPPCPQVVVIHDLLPLLYPDDYPKQRYFYRYILPWVLRRAEAVVAVSQNTKRDLVRRYGLPADKITVIYSGVDPVLFHPPPPGAKAAEPYVLSVGNQYAYKNIARLLEAFAGLARAGFPHRLLLAGENHPRRVSGLRRLVAELGLEDKVEFLGYVSRDELLRLYSSAELFVMPSLYEGFGLPVLEAMACGCPAAVSNGSSLPEAAGEAGAYFDPEDAADIERALAGLLRDPQGRSRMAAAGFEQVRKFSWEKAAQSYRELLENTANR